MNSTKLYPTWILLYPEGMLLRTRAAVLAFALAACGDETPAPKPARNVTEDSAPPAPEPADLVNELFTGLPVTATPDIQVRVITAFVGKLTHGAPASWAVPHLLRDRIVDNYSAVVVAAAFAQELGWEWQTVVFDCQPGTRFFLEANTFDGRFLVDPYGGFLVTEGGPNDRVLPFPDAFRSGVLYHYDGAWPMANYLDLLAAWKPAGAADIDAWRSAFSHACLASRYTPSLAVQHPITVDVAAGNLVAGKIDGSPWDVDAAFASPGQLRSDHAFLGGFVSPAGAVVLGHRLLLENTVPGNTYRYLFRTCEAVPGTFVAVSTQARLGGFKYLGQQVWALAITAVSSKTDVSLGMDSQESVSLDALAIGRFNEGDRPW